MNALAVPHTIAPERHTQIPVVVFVRCDLSAQSAHAHVGAARDAANIAQVAYLVKALIAMDGQPALYPLRRSAICRSARLIASLDAGPYHATAS